VQAVSQQTPSTQEPEPHSALDAQAMPFGFAHVPAVPATLHFAPPVQALEVQQTPSTQLPEAHEVPSTHAAPEISLAAHAPALQ
jgi:hypothetical protein